MLHTIQILGQDVRFALRQLRQRPGFTIVAIVAVAGRHRRRSRSARRSVNACLIPAARATRIDPTAALRQE